MNKEFLPYNEALALKKLGFDELCLGYYINKDKFRFAKPSHDEKFIPFYYKNCEAIKYLRCFMIIGKRRDTICTAPLYSQAFRWFRDKHFLKGVVDHANSNGSNTYNIWKWNFDNTVGKWERISPITTYDKWETAELACLQKLIEIVKLNKQ